jgi:hypothetical protein
VTVQSASQSSAPPGWGLPHLGYYGQRSAASTSAHQDGTLSSPWGFTLWTFLGEVTDTGRRLRRILNLRYRP